MTKSEIENAFTYHPPYPDQIKVYGEIRDRGLMLAAYLFAHCPESREKSLALTKLREAIMWANAAIACNGARFPQ